jgi:hypothetical protein
MSKETSKARLKERKEQTRKAETSRGLYDKVRSKFVKEKGTNYGAVISVARERLIARNGGKDPGSDMVAFHVEGGSHRNGKSNDEKAIWASKGDNSRESNYRRGGKSKKEIQKKLRLKY